MDAKQKVADLLNKFRESRERMRYSQEKMADLLGITQNSYKNIEKGISKLKAEDMYKIMHILGIEEENQEYSYAVNDKFLQEMKESQQIILKKIEQMESQMQDVRTLKQLFQNLIPTQKSDEKKLE